MFFIANYEKWKLESNIVNSLTILLPKNLRDSFSWILSLVVFSEVYREGWNLLLRSREIVAGPGLFCWGEKCGARRAWLGGARVSLGPRRTRPRCESGTEILSGPPPGNLGHARFFRIFFAKFFGSFRFWNFMPLPNRWNFRSISLGLGYIWQSEIQIFKFRSWEIVQEN